MNKNWQWFLPGYLLALPGTLIGLLLLVWYWPSSIRLRAGCIEIVSKRQLIGGPWVGAQTWGNVLYFRDERQRSRNSLHVHERVHVWQAMIYTWPLMAAAYGVHYLWRRTTRSHQAAYYGIWAEKQAYEKQWTPNAWGSLD